MKNMKEEKALILYESIGSINDAMAASALNYRKAHSYKALKLAAVLAACFAFMITVVIGSLRVIDGSFSRGEPISDGAAALDALDAVLYEKTDESLMTDASDIDFFSGEVSLIWRDGENYYLKPLGTKSELSELDKHLGKGEDVNSDVAPDYSVWISLGDGRVVSPYLKNTDGNVGYATLFDYDPEIEPTSSFVEYIDGLLE